MDALLVNLVLGISFGFILFLLGTGLSLTMGLMRIVNLAHGALYMVGAYTGVFVASSTGNFVLGVTAGGAAAAVCGLMMETGFLRKLYQRQLSQVLLTIGFVHILTNLVQWVWGALPLPAFIPSMLSGALPLGRINVPVFRLVIIAIGLAAAAGLWFFQEKTRLGAIIRAGMDNKEMATALGINLQVVFSGVFALGAFVAGFCGLFGAPTLGINLAIGWEALLFAMIVVIVGGAGSVQGALVGGLLIGIVDAYGKAFFPELAYFTIYLVLIIILLFRPNGLLGRSIGEVNPAGITTSLVTSMSTNLKPWQNRLFTLAPYLGAGIVFLFLPPFLPTYYLSMLTKVVIFGIFAMSLDLVLGYTGLISLGHAAFLGIGGYTFGILMIRGGINSFWVLVPSAIAVTSIIAAITGYIALRVSGVYFLLITLAFGQLFSSVAVKWRAMTGGTDGLVGIKYPSLGLPGFVWTEYSFYYLVLIIFALCFFLLYRIVNSSFGHAIVGIRENEPRMQSLGYNTWVYKYAAFIIGGIFAGAAGALFAPFYGAVMPSHLGLITSAMVMLMVVIGSPGTLFGPVIGSLVVLFLEYFSSVYSPERWPLVLGGVFVICVLFLRDGIGLHLARSWRRLRHWYGTITS